MKRLIVVLFVLFLVGGMAALSFAQATQVAAAKKAEVKTEVIMGKIISIDTVKNEVVIKENKTATEKTIVVDAKVISLLKTDEAVKVSLKEGTNIALSIKKLVKKTTSTTKK
jgi:hypothetical protein